ncbi:MAG: tetratricopeptide repeat protein [Verrucomicrobia bacterium]|nr:tetratricopeptide repeat protein [Verrucomicrobiota bacterium]
MAKVLAIALSLAVLAGCGRPDRSPRLGSETIEAMNQGVGFMGQYDYERAVAAFEKVVKVAPALTDARINLAISLFNRGRKEDQDIDRASSMLDEVLAKEPDNVRASYFKGIILQHVGKAQEAMMCFEKVVKLRPDDGIAWYLLGLCQQRAGQSPENALKRAIELRPNLYSAYYQLYQSALRGGDTNKAREYMDRFMALRQSPAGESVELPQYNQMGDLALARPIASRSRPVSKSRFTPAPATPLWEGERIIGWSSTPRRPDKSNAADAFLAAGGVAAGDFDLDGRVELVLTATTPDAVGRLVLLKQNNQGAYEDVTAGSGLEQVRNALSCAVGDFDNDGKPDLFIACAGPNFLFKNDGAGKFSNVTESAGVAALSAISSSAVFFDADHDGDLDIFVCNAAALDGNEPVRSQLLNNNGDGTFKDIASTAGVDCAGSKTVMVLFGDVDDDRDADLLVLRAGAAARLFLNDLGGRYHEAPDRLDVRGDLGAAMQDFDGDGHLDILALGAENPQLQLYLGDGRGRFVRSSGFEGTAKTAATWGPIRAMRIGDVDLDGDLDLALFGKEAHLLFNTGSGTFVWQTRAWPDYAESTECIELFDLTGDFVPDLLVADRSNKSQIRLFAGQLAPPSTGLALAPTGLRERDGRTRSPASGYGVKLTVRAGLLEQMLIYTGQSGGPCQSFLPPVAGLGGHTKADYVAFHWPDGVAQFELGLGAGSVHKVSELQRKVSSCPVLFAWNGNRFEFVTDFAGVGGLGYYVSPSESATPQALEHIKIDADKLRARGGVYELRITEPMEEAAYIDRLELVAIDHPAELSVFPDERLAVSGPVPTHELIVIDRQLQPLRAVDCRGQDCTAQILRADRVYAYDPPLDRRYFGFCQSHSLELDFGGQLEKLGTRNRVFLFIRGYIEYPYSQTVYAAAQSGVKWEPIRIDRQATDGRWETIVPDAGAPGGMDRTMTVELTGLIGRFDRRLRLTTNLEIGYDQVFIGVHVGTDNLVIQPVPMVSAELRRAGFAREYSPDGRLPLIYDYENADASAPFHVLRGAYTRYGQVTELLREFDSMYAIIGPGDEIALTFDAAAVTPCPAGFKRSFILVSHAWCKDMDLYTAEPQTLEPLPFRGMTKYPYDSRERFPDTPELRAYRATYNTRMAY